MLLKAGADIYELNTVRKHISKVKGGRLAELAYPAKIISLILSDAAGAIVDGETVKKARAKGLDPGEYLNNNDSHGFFKKIDELLVTGPTGTNVMDIQIAVIE